MDFGKAGAKLMCDPRSLEVRVPEISRGDAIIQKPHLELVKLAADSIGFMLNVWFLLMLLVGVIGPLVVIWVHIKQPKLVGDFWPGYAALAFAIPVGLAYVLRWLSKGVIERRPLPLILVGLASLLFGLASILSGLLLLSIALPSDNEAGLPQILSGITAGALSFIYSMLLVIALIEKV